MAISRPNVSLTVIDDSITIPTTESGSPTIGLCISAGETLNLGVFGTTAEKTAGYYFVGSLNDWYGRLQSFTQKENNLDGNSGLTFIANYLGTQGATLWTTDWYAVNNYLQYGGGCYVGFTSSTSTSGYEAVTPDVVFAGSTKANPSVASYAKTKASKNEPVFSIFGINKTYFISEVPGACSSNLLQGVSSALGDDASQFSMVVYGEKNQLNAGGEASKLITTILAPDIAGCFARTDKNSFPWISPAGIRRGQILNAVSLVETLSETQQDNLYNLDINPVLNFAGEGTFLFGDRTYNTGASSTLDAVNVARLVIYLRKVLGQLGRTILFEQNDSISRNRFLTSADSVLRTIKAQSGVSDYKIICDETNNPPSVIQARQFVADILIKAIPSINYVKITITNKNLSATL